MTRPRIKVVLPRAALSSIFDECDRFDADENGGRLIGTYEERAGFLTVRVEGVIGPGPNARRSSVSFFQDGTYQEAVFRKIEQLRPEIEHLGNWHTHHVNGFPTLSGGDIATYKRIVNHKNHNTTFFYALLVTAKHDGRDAENRYSIKHFVLHRGDVDVHEVPRACIELADLPIISTATDEAAPPTANVAAAPRLPTVVSRDNGGRALDNSVLGELFPSFKPFSSEQLGIYWRGHLELVNGTRIEAFVLERDGDRGRHCTILVKTVPDALRRVSEALAQQDFQSVRAALIALERSCNQTLYKAVEKAESSHAQKS